jgi:GH35 family endo-1,4-beta-xylanase
LLQKKAKLSGIGFMGHFNGATLTAPKKIYEIMDRFAVFGLDMQITEFDVSGVSDELQADYVRDVLTISYSHPKMVGVVIWGFYEKLHWRPDAAFIRNDLSRKPAADVWDDLVNKEWRTNADLVSDANGLAKINAYEGEYEITITRGKQKAVQKLTLLKDEKLIIRL